ncbi:hypothetical protein O181_019305 [Austropuccinia psidii MF-1]|uniref:Uncharacterized protein n=1 Tax=Austropuccinia psidii MF-1 TaxID=1389203 RepID=A0A9Q3GUW9_9BASI|nr:hypothetical protein [Austropuccinia psidii MF-1]
MSEEYQITLMSYANLVPVIKLPRLNNSVIPTSNPSQQLQKAFTFVWCSGAHHSRWGVLSQPHVITLPMSVYGKYSLTPFYGQLDHFSVLWPFGNITFHWPLMSSDHILQPLGLFSNSPPHQPPVQYLFFGPGGPSGLPGASGPSSHHQGLWPNPFDYGF